MSRHRLKAQARVTQKMTKDGLVERNETTGDSISVSSRDAEVDLHVAATADSAKGENITAVRASRQSYSQAGNKFSSNPNRRNKQVYEKHKQTKLENQPQQADTVYNEQHPPHTQPMQVPELSQFQQIPDKQQSLQYEQQSEGSRQNPRHGAQQEKLNRQLSNTTTPSALIIHAPTEPAIKHEHEASPLHTVSNHTAYRIDKNSAIRHEHGSTHSQKTRGRKQAASPNQDSADTQSAAPYTHYQSAPGSEAAITDQPGTDGKPSEADPGSEVPKSSRLVKAEKGFERTNTKLDSARANLPSGKKPRSRLVFDEEKPKRESFIQNQPLSRSEHMKTPAPLRSVKAAATGALNFGHRKIFQVEHENVEIKAAHRVELAAESSVRHILRFRKTMKYRKVTKLERAAANKKAGLAYRQALERNPKLKSSPLSRMWQKQKIKRQYAKAARATSKVTLGAKKGGALSLKVVNIAVRSVLRNPKVIGVLLVAGLVVFIVMTIINLGISIGGGVLGGLAGGAHLADDSSINSAAVIYSEWETELRFQIDTVQESFPGFDEYRFNIGEIGHQPLQLLAYLTAAHNAFIYPDIREVLRELFYEQYQLSFQPSVEIMIVDDGQGNLDVKEWHVLTTTLTSRPLSEVIDGRLTDAQRHHFDFLIESGGARHIVGSPFPFDWRPHISSHYGWRIHPIFGYRRFHRGVDIALPTGTPILAAHDGTVTFAGWQGGFGLIVIIDGGNGVVTKYAHCHTLLVSAGQSVSRGQVIATVGSTGDSTGPHLHFEVHINGESRNPVLFAFTGG